MHAGIQRAPNSIFADLSETEYADLLGTATERTYATGEVVFKEGAEGDEFFVVSEGTIEIAKEVAGGRRKLITRCRPGEVFGEMVVFQDAQVRSATALTESPVRVSVLGREPFLAYLHEHPEIAAKVLFRLVHVLCERLRRADERLTEAIHWGFQAQG